MNFNMMEKIVWAWMAVCAFFSIAILIGIVMLVIWGVGVINDIVYNDVLDDEQQPTEQVDPVANAKES